MGHRILCNGRHIFESKQQSWTVCKVRIVQHVLENGRSLSRYLKNLLNLSKLFGRIKNCLRVVEKCADIAQRFYSIVELIQGLKCFDQLSPASGICWNLRIQCQFCITIIDISNLCFQKFVPRRCTKLLTFFIKRIFRVGHRFTEITQKCGGFFI